jgi:hypothetical protein
VKVARRQGAKRCWGEGGDGRMGVEKVEPCIRADSPRRRRPRGAQE